MNLVISLVAYPAAVATVLFVVTLLVLRVVDRPERPASPALAEALFSLVLLRLVLPGSVAAPWTISGVWDRVTGWWNAGESPVAALPWFGAVLGEASSANGPAALGTAGQAPGLSPMTTVLALLGIVWVGGAVVCLVGLIRGRRRVAALVAASRPAAEPRVLEALERWRDLLGVRRAAAVRLTAEPVSPFACERCGVVRPVVVLPETLLDTPDHAEAALAHELAHVARRDDLRLLVQRVVEALWWWWPVARWAGAHLTDARERAADARVLAPHAHGRPGALAPAAYGRALLAVAGTARRSLHDLPAVPAASVAAFVRHSTSKKRIAMRLESLVRHRPETLGRAVVALAAAGALALLLSPGLGASAEVPDTSETPGNTASAGVPDTSGKAAVAHPLPQSCVTSHFGQRTRPVAPDAGQMKLHQGVDMKAELGRAVLAPAHGRVVLATERDPEREWLGTVVVVAHGNGLESTFAHLGTLSVATGDQVKMNQVLGTVGVTGNTTGPHLHWEVRQDGELVNPVMLLTAGLRPAATEDC